MLLCSGPRSTRHTHTQKQRGMSASNYTSRDLFPSPPPPLSIPLSPSCPSPLLLFLRLLLILLLLLIFLLFLLIFLLLLILLLLFSSPSSSVFIFPSLALFLPSFSLFSFSPASCFHSFLFSLIPPRPPPPHPLRFSLVSTVAWQTPQNFPKQK